MGKLTFPDGQSVFLDANILIYYAEDAAPYAQALATTFEAIAHGRIKGVVSALSLLETIVVPLRQDNRAGAERFAELLRYSPHIEYVPITDEILMRAAEIRAATELRTPDAIHIATAQLQACDAVLTNDRRLEAVGSPPIVVLNDHVRPD